MSCSSCEDEKIIIKETGCAGKYQDTDCIIYRGEVLDACGLGAGSSLTSILLCLSNKVKESSTECYSDYNYNCLPSVNSEAQFVKMITKEVCTLKAKASEYQTDYKLYFAQLSNELNELNKLKLISRTEMGLSKVEKISEFAQKVVDKIALLESSIINSSGPSLNIRSDNSLKIIQTGPKFHNIDIRVPVSQQANNAFRLLPDGFFVSMPTGGGSGTAAPLTYNATNYTLSNGISTVNIKQDVNKQPTYNSLTRVLCIGSTDDCVELPASGGGNSTTLNFVDSGTIDFTASGSEVTGTIKVDNTITDNILNKTGNGVYVKVADFLTAVNNNPALKTQFCAIVGACKSVSNSFHISNTGGSAVTVQYRDNTGTQTLQVGANSFATLVCMEVISYPTATLHITFLGQSAT